jgi:CheY-like chemotaxis protein
MSCFSPHKTYFSVVHPEPVILVAEDNDNDVALLLRAFQKGKLSNPVQVVRDGEQAIAYLQGEGRFQNRAEYPLPSLLLLDLKMPRKDGFEVLEWIRRQEGLRALPVVVLTLSEELKDVNRAYQMGANSFLVKPIDFLDSVALVEAVKSYWLGLSRTPEVSRSPRIPPSPTQNGSNTLPQQEEMGGVS